MNKKRYNRRRSQYSRSLILIPIMVGIIFILISTLPKMPDADVHLLITMNGWNPNHFEAKAGVPIRIMVMTLSEEASHPDNIHSFVLKETGTEVYVKAGESIVFTIIFPKPGTYTFWCTTCCGGVNSPNMAGTVTVT